jgi:hypothetical protein
MRVKDLIVREVPLSTIRSLIETLHYSHSVNGLRVSQCFGLYDEDKLIGGMIYGKMGMANAWKKYAEKEDDVVELRRLAIIDDTPPTVESYFIGKTLRWLTQNTTIQTVVSYADNTHGHTGVIYRASNFQFKGETAAGKMIEWNGKLYHDKSIRTTYTNKDGVKALKPFAQRIKDALEQGEAHWVKTKTKNIYVYSLRNRTVKRVTKGSASPQPSMV